MSRECPVFSCQSDSGLSWTDEPVYRLSTDDSELTTHN
jgi:hypothetical protein